MNIKQIGASALSKRIFLGTLNTIKSKWVGKKEDVTDMCLAAAAEHLLNCNKDICFPTKDGKFLVLSATVHDTLPAQFK